MVGIAWRLERIEDAMRGMPLGRGCCSMNLAPSATFLCGGGFL
jgi:hypothetical protein